MSHLEPSIKSVGSLDNICDLLKLWKYWKQKANHKITWEEDLDVKQSIFILNLPNYYKLGFIILSNTDRLRKLKLDAESRNFDPLENLYENPEALFELTQEEVKECQTLSEQTIEKGSRTGVAKSKIDHKPFIQNINFKSQTFGKIVEKQEPYKISYKLPKEESKDSMVPIKEADPRLTSLGESITLNADPAQKYLAAVKYQTDSCEISNLRNFKK